MAFLKNAAITAGICLAVLLVVYRNPKLEATLRGV
jgi:hypothetical protein